MNHAALEKQTDNKSVGYHHQKRKAQKSQHGCSEIHNPQDGKIDQVVEVEAIEDNLSNYNDKTCGGQHYNTF